MDKTIMGLLGGASAFALLGAGQAAAAAPADGANTLQPARSFAELLDPIPNAVNVLKAENERAAEKDAAGERPIVMAQYYHHHHHHHHHYYHHHHHHHYHHRHHHYYHSGY